MSPDEACAEMQGLSLRNTGVQLRDEKGKTVYQDFGELLFTHFGVSGPTVLSASAHLKPGKSNTRSCSTSSPRWTRRTLGRALPARFRGL